MFINVWIIISDVFIIINDVYHHQRVDCWPWRVIV